MEEGDNSVEQSAAVEAQGEALTRQGVGGLAVQIPPMQFPTQYDGAAEFKGTVDPLEVKQWLESMERVFKKLQYTYALKFEYAISLLRGDAYEWWKTIPNSMLEPPVLTWEDFLREFRQKYIPDAYVDMKLQEFLSLK
ncbi:uncharacterized protein LOC131177825 [Hevea brasiliensis]|uniref:uncharacterized protein LOC131177825 n=1 Tax=Hevea brasiliensis TaxID=3981 RepID=UPI0025F86446|nr:uncharacterized protein LOC131177825 [Hevea brasiliensis]